jgi:DNA-binding SARP family transcriptional activator
MSNNPLSEVFLPEHAPEMGDARRASTREAEPHEGASWPLQLFTFGRFSIVKNGAPLALSRKTPKKPITLLKVILALGGRDVSQCQLADTLWQGEEGDAAHDALAVNLHRLRKLLGDHDAVILHDGQVSLDPRRCWVDAWVFQRLLGEAAIASGEQRTTLIESALVLYRGAYLACHADEPWSLSMRERLRGKFIRSTAELGKLREESGLWERAIECYQRGLEADELGEEFYQGLMRCYWHLDRRAEGISVYRRLRATLSIILCIAASPTSEELLRQLLLL